MKQGFKFYAIIWTILFAIYNVVVFTVQAIPGYKIEYDARFWIFWSFILVAFLGLLACVFFAFKSNSNDKLFFKVPLVKQSYISVVAMAVVGSVCMLIPDMPLWIASIVCVLAFGYNAIGVLKAKTAIDIVADVDTTVQAQTSFIKSLTADAESLVARGQTKDIQAELKKVYEVIRYSERRSCEGLAAIENQITATFSSLTAAVTSNDAEAINALADQVILLVNDRSNKCKLMK